MALTAVLTAISSVRKTGSMPRYSGAPAGPARCARRAAFAGGLLDVHPVGLGQRRRATAEPVRHPELAGRMRPVGVLDALEQMLHPRVQ